MRVVTGAIITVLITGCGFFTRAKSTFYSLETTPAAARSASAGAPVGIEGIELPPGLDRREIVVRTADNKLEMRERQQWAGPLEDMVIHTLAFNLANRLPEGMVILPGQAKPAGAMRPIHIIFEDLAAGPDRQFILDARWVTNNRVTHERIAVPMASTDSAAIVTAMNSALGTLADRIASALSG